MLSRAIASHEEPVPSLQADEERGTLNSWSYQAFLPQMP